jgi:ATP-binding cassette subfamily B protein
MWNRQREAEAAREKLALADEDAVAPNRLPPPVVDDISAAATAASSNRDISEAAE